MPTSQNPEAAPRNPARRKAMTAVVVLVTVAGIGYGAYWALFLNHFERTDNAYVQGNVVQVTPQIAGTVIAINTDDTAHVKAGDVLVRFDPADAQVALEQAEARLAQTVREVRSVYANNSTFQAQIDSRAADLSRARVELDRAQDDVARRAPLVATGAVGKEEFDHANAQLATARSAVVAAQSSVLAAREQLAANQTQTAGVAVDQHPNVLTAAARVREAYLTLSRTKLVAPIDGYVAKRSVQLGQRVGAGAPLMSLIALDRVWVEANFKESQLQRLRIGQPVEVKVDISNTDGRMLSDGSTPMQGLATEVFAQDDAAAALRVRSVIAANIGSSARKRPVAPAAPASRTLASESRDAARDAALLARLK